MKCKIDLLFSPAEYARLPEADLSTTTCVVFDILRATTTMTTALANGAKALIPVAEIEEAVAWRRKDASILLAGERGGLRITAGLSGGFEFDLGNSPREFTAPRVAGRTIAITTTNGTRALRACAAAEHVWVGSFLGLSALVNRLKREQPRHLLLVCSGTAEEASTEDTLAAGAFAAHLAETYSHGKISDSDWMASDFYLRHESDLIGAMRFARNGRRLLAMDDLKDDVSCCLARDTVDFLVQIKHGKVDRAS